MGGGGGGVMQRTFFVSQMNGETQGISLLSKVSIPGNGVFPESVVQTHSGECADTPS